MEAYLKNQFNNSVKLYHKERSSKAWSMWQHHIPQNIFFESSKQLSDFCLANSRIPYFWQVLESIHKCIIELLVLKCLFVGSLIKNKEGVGLFSVSQKEGLSIFYDNQVLLRLMSQCGPPSCTLQNRSYSPLHFGQEENIPEHSIERRAYWFVVKIARVLLIPTGRVGIVSWTLL